jgi:mannose-6-phosphate isomerase-like protein (cupin superfamily)
VAHNWTKVLDRFVHSVDIVMKTTTEEDEMSEPTNEAEGRSTSGSTTAPVLVRRAPDAEVLEADPTSVITLLADAEETGGKLTSNLTHFEPGNAGAPPHHHSRGAELFYVLDGSLQMLLGDEVTVFGTGDLVVVPPGVHHAFAPAPGAGADVLIVFAPGTERFAYYRLLDRLHQGDASVQDLYDTQDRFDNHYVESPAWQANR